MPKPIIPVEQFSDMLFPSLGMDLTLGFGMQRDGTTREGQNVRVYEPTTDRSRGGSRPGIAQYVPDLVGGPNLIQHLNYVVDPQAQAYVDYDPPGGVTGGPNPFGGAFDPYSGLPVPAGGTYLDPTGPPRVTVPRTIRYGGTGAWFSKKRKAPVIAWVQDSAGQATAGGLTTADATFIDNVVAGHTLIAGVCSIGFPGNAVNMTVADSLGNTYTQADSTVRFADGGNFYAVSLWYCLASVASGVCTITTTSDTANVGGSSLTMGVQEYSGVGSFDQTSTNTGAASLTFTTGSVSVSAAGSLVLGVFAFSTGSAVVFDGTITDMQFGAFGKGGWILDQSTAFPISGTRTIGALGYAGVGASFKP